MTKKIISKSEELLKEIEKLGKFNSRYEVYPYRKVAKVAEGLRKLASSLPNIENPKNQDELIQSELKRRLIGEAFYLDQILTNKHYDFQTVVSIFGIPVSDINDLEKWLKENRDGTLDAVDRLYKVKDVKSYELDLQEDIPSVKRQAEEFAAVHIEKYHRILGKLLQDLTKVGEFLIKIRAVPTTERRSYFNRLTNTLAISIPKICYTNEDGSMQIREKELIAIYGHEGMAHALNQLITKSNNMPYFLTWETHLTSATSESVAQFYENVIFEDLKNSPEVQKELGIKHIFNEIYQENQDIKKLNEYKAKLFQYAITVLADKKLGEPQDSKTLDKKREILEKVTLDPSYPLHFVENNRYNFDSQGNLKASLIAELRYCAKPVQRALDEFKKQGIKYERKGRSLIDSVLLRGFWTPQGYVDNARLSAKKM